MTKILARICPVMLAALVLTGLAGIVFHRLVVNPSAILVDPDRPSVDRAVLPEDRSVGNDATRTFLPLHLRIAASVGRNGHIPGWDAFGFGGRPLVGNPQAGIWYPPTWLAWKFRGFSALGWAAVGHLIWGGLGVFVLLRSQRVGWLASMVGAATWIYAPYVLAQTYEGHYPHVWAASWFSWTFWAAYNGRFRWLVPPFLALGFLTGHPQETYYLAISLAIGLGWSMLVHLGKGNYRAAIAGFALGAAIAAAVLGMTAIEWIPDSFSQPYALRFARLSARDAGKYHVNNLNLIQLLDPRALGGPADYFGPGSYWEPLLAIGWAPLVLVAAAVSGSPRRKFVGGWVALIVGSALFAWGSRLGVFRLFFAVVPGMGRFRVPARALFLATTGAAVLAGLGAETLLLEIRLKSGFFRGYNVIVGVLMIVLGWAVFHDPGSRLETDRAVWVHAAARVAADPIFLASCVGTTFLLGCVHRNRWPRHAAIALCLLSMGELGFYGQDLIRVSPPSRFTCPEGLSRAILAVRPDGPSRIRAKDAFFGDLRAVTLGLEKTNANDSFQIQHAADVYERLYGMFGDRIRRPCSPREQQAVLDRMNVGLLISDRQLKEIDWPVAGSHEGFFLYTNPRTMPRAYVVPRAEVTIDEASMVARFADISPEDAVFLSFDPLEKGGSRQPFTPATYESDDPGRLDIHVTTQLPGLLVVADTWMPGWSAEVDGRPTEILRGNRAHRVVPIRDPGAHHIVMRYDPPGLAVGRGITLGSAAIWAVAFGLSWGSPLRWGSLRGRREAGNR